MKRSPRVLVPLLLFLASAARADLDPEAKKPYELQVVLHVAENRVLTPLFQEQLEREIRAQLQLTFGPLATVEVVRQHPLLREALNKGLQQTLDGWNDLSDRTTAFVLVDYSAGEYRLLCRLHDGMTAVAGPGVRHTQTADPRQVAEGAVEALVRDFGVAGTVTAAGDEVELTLRGGALGVPLGPWLKPGDVFTVTRVTKEGGKLRAARVPWTVLQVLGEPRHGKCRCRLLHRFAEDRLTGEPGVLGYRCVRLPTITGPLRLRLIDAATFEPLDGLQVHVRVPGGDKAREYASNRDGLIATTDSFAQVVEIEVLQGTTRLARFPVELVDDRPVTCRIKTSALAESQAPLEYRRDQWVRRLYENLRVASERVTALNQLLGRSLEAARAAAAAGLQNMTEEITSLEIEGSALSDLAVKNKLAPDRFLREGEQRLEELKKRKQDLADFAARLEQAVGSEKTRALLAQARLFENDAKIEQALKHYDDAILLFKQLTLREEDAQELKKVEGHVAQLRQAWRPRGPEHAAARKFVYETWPGVEPAKLTTQLPKAREALQICRKADDRLTLRKLALANATHAANLKKRLDVLKAKESPDNRAEASRIVQLAEQLDQLHAEVSAMLRAEKK